jgi:hypothetical protein
MRNLMLLAAALAPVLFGVASRSRKTILVSAVITPVLLGVLTASDPSPRRGLFTMVALVAAFELLYALLLYYVWLRLPWG